MQMPNYCPNCGKRLELKQINLQSAILLCTNLKCPYPVEGDCIVVKRSISNTKEEIGCPEKVENSQISPQSQSTENTKLETDLMMASIEKLLNSESSENQPYANDIIDLDSFILDLLQ